MKKALIIGGAVLAALIPAGAGLAANTSLSTQVPISPVQASISASSTSGPSGSPTSGSSSSPTSRPTSSRTADDRGGDRPRGVSDDPATHDANDDKGGTRKGSDDSSGHDAADDKGGSSDGSSGDGSGHGSDD